MNKADGLTEKISIGHLLGLIPEDEKISLVDVCYSEEVYIGTAHNLPAGLRKWTTEGVIWNGECSLMLYGAHPCMEKETQK